MHNLGMAVPVDYVLYNHPEKTLFHFSIALQTWLIAYGSMGFTSHLAC